MKRLPILFLFLIFIGCAGLQIQGPQVEAPPGAQVGDVFRIEEITSQSAANKIRAFTEIEGGASGALDAIDCQVLAENDLAFAYHINSKTNYFYWFDDGATDAEDSPWIIRPDNYATCSDGVWKAMTGFGFGPTSQPKIVFRDLEATDFDDNVYINTNCSATGTGAEDCYLEIWTQRNGAAARYMAIPSDGDTAAGFITLCEDPDNGDNCITIDVADSIDANYAIIVPSANDTLVGKATTDTFTNKTLDASATGNTVKLYGYIHLTHPHMADGTGATIDTTESNAYYGQALFADDANYAANYVEYRLMVPSDIDTSVDLVLEDMAIRLADADTAAHCYQIEHDSVADSASYDTASFGQRIDVEMAADASGASGDVEIMSDITLTDWKSNVTAGQLWVIRVSRDGDGSECSGGDASTVDSYSGPIVIRYGITQ